MNCSAFRSISLCLLTTAGTLALPAAAQTPAPMPAPGDMPKPPMAAAPNKNGVKPYSEVITKEAKTDDGIFKVHRIDDKVFFEIPARQLGREILWVTTFQKTQTAYGYGGTEVQDRVVRWVKRGDKLLLRVADFQVRAEGDALKRSVEDSTLEPIIQVFDVKAYGPDDAPVIDVTNLFTGDVPEFSARKLLNASRMDSQRSFLEKIKAFPRNIEAEVTATYAVNAGPQIIFGRSTGPSRDSSVESATVMLHHSIVALPDDPMLPRYFDSRVGFFNGRYYAYNDVDHRVKERQLIRRWRLEKKDPAAALSEPVKPIVYYVGKEVPAKWRPWVKKGIEAWQPAFEAAGFKNAIVAKDPPSEAEDPDWDAEDVRYSVIRWLPSTIENAYGPHVADPRTGEILDADVKIYHNVLKLSTDWYFVQASPNDSRAQKLPLPDDLVGQLLQYVVTHEVGHTLGLMHNMKASSAFTVAQLRSRDFTEKWGTEASVMDYGRFNYVAQPGDQARLIPTLGPYDHFAIEWGYKPVPNARTPEDEKPALDALAARQVKDPTLRFGNAGSDDPGRQTEDLGSDPVAATGYGLKNLQRVLGYLIPATGRTGDDYDLLNEMYDQVLGQRNRELMHVTAVVGGVTETDYHYGRGGAVYTPVPEAKQREAVQFLVNNCFATPKEMIRPDILGKIEAQGVQDRILGGQLGVLNTLLSEYRIQRMTDQCALNGKGYTPAELMDDLRKGIWSELSAPRVAVDPYRRNLQRAYIQALRTRIAPASAGQTDMRPLSRGALTDTRAAIRAALPRAADRETRLHLEDCATTIARVLEARE